MFSADRFPNSPEKFQGIHSEWYEWQIRQNRAQVSIYVVQHVSISWLLINSIWTARAIRGRSLTGMHRHFCNHGYTGSVQTKEVCCASHITGSSTYLGWYCCHLYLLRESVAGERASKISGMGLRFCCWCFLMDIALTRSCIMSNHKRWPSVVGFYQYTHVIPPEKQAFEPYIIIFALFFSFAPENKHTRDQCSI